jgi:hypothetical protein
MESLNFAVEFKSDVVIKMADREVRQISIAGNTIGYIAINGDVITPFTAAGECSEVDCISCAAKALFSTHTGLPSENVELAKAEGQRGQLFEGTVMAALMKAAMNNSRSVN